MREHHALGLAGGARRVDDGGEILVTDGGAPGFEGRRKPRVGRELRATAIEDRRERQHRAPRPSGPEALSPGPGRVPARRPARSTAPAPPPAGDGGRPGSSAPGRGRRRRPRGSPRRPGCTAPASARASGRPARSRPRWPARPGRPAAIRAGSRRGCPAGRPRPGGRPRAPRRHGGRRRGLPASTSR